MIKSFTLFLLPEDWVHLGAPALAQSLSRHAFLPCGPTVRQSAGWVPPRGVAHAPLAESVAGQVLMKLQVETRLLPSSAVKAHVEERMDLIEAQSGRRPRGRARKELKEQVEHELLPRAFTRQVGTLVWLDPKARRVVIGTTTARALDAVLAELSRAFESALPLLPASTAESPSTVMGSWLREQEPPAAFTIDRECELRQPDDGKATVRYVRHALDNDGVAEHIRQGKVPVQLAMTWNGRVSFLLTEDLRIKRLKFLDIQAESGEGRDAASKEEAFDGEAALMTGELAGLLDDLLPALGGVSP